MRDTFRRVFNPTDDERQQMYDRLNNLVDKTYEAFGECCATCKHERYVQESPYYDYVTCEYDRTLEFGFGDGDEYHHCDKYEFCGYFEVKEKNHV